MLGRFGISLDKAVSKVVTYQTFTDYIKKYRIISYKTISDNKLLVTYIPSIDVDIVKQHKQDIIKVVSKNIDNEAQHRDNTSIPISAAVTAYARIHISNIKLDILKKGGNIYYSDTDSIVTDLKLESNLVDSKQIGKLKLEHEIEKALFITNKLYCFFNKNGEFHATTKGIDKSTITYSDFVKLYNGTSVNTAIKTRSKADWGGGYVEVHKSKITVSAHSYTKRTKVISNNVWTDTSAVIVNDVDVSNNENNVGSNNTKNRDIDFTPVKITASSPSVSFNSFIHSFKSFIHSFSFPFFNTLKPQIINLMWLLLVLILFLVYIFSIDMADTDTSFGEPENESSISNKPEYKTDENYVSNINKHKNYNSEYISRRVNLAERCGDKWLTKLYLSSKFKDHSEDRS